MKPLSIQIHPDDEYALGNENEFGKNEMWYVVEDVYKRQAERDSWSLLKMFLEICSMKNSVAGLYIGKNILI